LKGRGRSILRNPLIAETMYKSEDIEKWASGLKRIYDECRTAGVKVGFETISMGFLVTFYRPKWEQGEGLEKGRQKTEKTDEGLDEGLNEGLKSLLEAVQDRPGIQAKDLVRVLGGRPLKTVERQVKTLIKAKRIERRGSRKTGGYYAIGESAG